MAKTKTKDAEDMVDDYLNMSAEEIRQMSPHWGLVLFHGIILGIIGLLLLFSPGNSMIFLVQILGLYWFATGLFAIFEMFLPHDKHWGWLLFQGILGIVAGIFIFNNPVSLAILSSVSIVIVAGWLGIIIGAVMMFQGFFGKGFWRVIAGIASILLGIIILANAQIASTVAAISIPILLAIVAIVASVFLIWSSFELRKMPKAKFAGTKK